MRAGFKVAESDAMAKKNLLCLTEWMFTHQCVLYAGSERGEPSPTASYIGLRVPSAPQSTSSVVSNWLVTVTLDSGRSSSWCAHAWHAGGEMLHTQSLAW